MSKYNIDNGETAIVDKIKHYDKRNQAENLNRQLLTKDFLCRLYMHVGNWNVCPSLSQLGVLSWRSSWK